jgi:hypothetical protein
MVRSMYLTLKVLGSNPCFNTFCDQLSMPHGGGGGGPTWWRAAGRGGANHRADGAELTMYYNYEYKYTKY